VSGEGEWTGGGRAALRLSELGRSAREHARDTTGTASGAAVAGRRSRRTEAVKGIVQEQELRAGGERAREQQLADLARRERLEPPRQQPVQSKAHDDVLGGRREPAAEHARRKVAFELAEGGAVGVKGDELNVRTRRVRRRDQRVAQQARLARAVGSGHAIRGRRAARAGARGRDRDGRVGCEEAEAGAAERVRVHERDHRPRRPLRARGPAQVPGGSEKGRPGDRRHRA
jgi:hypothetical protein